MSTIRPSLTPDLQMSKSGVFVFRPLIVNNFNKEMSNHKHISRQRRMYLKHEEAQQEAALAGALKESSKRHRNFLYVVQELKKETFNHALGQQDRRYSELNGFLNDENWVKLKANLLEGLAILTEVLEKKCPEW
ncbi:MAG: hypothetical protein ACK41O_00195, partial [Runella zeae]